VRTVADVKSMRSTVSNSGIPLAKIDDVSNTPC